jgi:hypothetical protein
LAARPAAAPTAAPVSAPEVDAADVPAVDTMDGTADGIEDGTHPELEETAADTAVAAPDVSAKSLELPEKAALPTVVAAPVDGRLPDLLQGPVHGQPGALTQALAGTITAGTVTAAGAGLMAANYSLVLGLATHLLGPGQGLFGWSLGESAAVGVVCTEHCWHATAPLSAGFGRRWALPTMR